MRTKTKTTKRDDGCFIYLATIIHDDGTVSVDGYRAREDAENAVKGCRNAQVSPLYCYPTGIHTGRRAA